MYNCTQGRSLNQIYILLHNYFRKVTILLRLQTAIKTLTTSKIYHQHLQYLNESFHFFMLFAWHDALGVASLKLFYTCDVSPSGRHFHEPYPLVFTALRRPQHRMIILVVVPTAVNKALDKQLAVRRLLLKTN